MYVYTARVAMCYSYVSLITTTHMLLHVPHLASTHTSLAVCSAVHVVRLWTSRTSDSVKELVRMTTVGSWNLINLLLMNCMCPYPFIPSYYLLVWNVIICLLTPNCKRTVGIMHYEACTRGVILYYNAQDAILYYNFEVMHSCILAHYVIFSITYSYIYNSRPVAKLHVCAHL